MHIKTVHEGVKDFECQFCPKKFTTQSNLRVHLAALHTGDMPHKCNVCNKGFTRKKMMLKHAEKCFVQPQRLNVAPSVKPGIAIVPDPNSYITSMGDIIL